MLMFCLFYGMKKKLLPEKNKNKNKNKNRNRNKKQTNKQESGSEKK